MQFSNFIAAAALVAVAKAVSFTDVTFNDVTAGQPFTISWTNATGDVTLTLKNGNPQALDTVSTIGSGLTGTSFVWNVPSTLVNLETYAIEIQDQSPLSSVNPNYSEQFQLIGGVTSSASSTPSSSASSPTASSNSTSSTSSLPSISSSSSASSATSSSSSVNNSTTTAKTTTSGSSSTTSTLSATGASTSTSAPHSGSSELSSPLAFVFLAVAAILTLN